MTKPLVPDGASGLLFPEIIRLVQGVSVEEPEVPALPNRTRDELDHCAVDIDEVVAGKALRTGAELRAVYP